jgi:aspartyl-tRNA(Asn)/glutamyl-tRNA(Gln) amidotransferase subunit C
MIDIDKIEKLAALKLKEKEKKAILNDLEEIIHYFEILKEVDTEDVEPQIYTKEACLFLRKDKAENGLNKEDLEKNKTLASGNFYRVKHIIGE